MMPQERGSGGGMIATTCLVMLATAIAVGQVGTATGQASAGLSAEQARSVRQCKAVRILVSEAYEGAQGTAIPQVRDACKAFLEAVGFKVAASEAEAADAVFKVDVRGSRKTEIEGTSVKGNMLRVDVSLEFECPGVRLTEVAKPGWAGVGRGQLPERYGTALDGSGFYGAMSSLFAALLNQDTWQPMAEALRKSRSTPQVRVSMIRALTQMGDARAGSAVEPLLKDPDGTVRSMAAMSLGRMECSQSVGLLIGAMDDTDVGVRISAASSLGLLGDEAALQALSKALGDSNAEVRGAATEALGRLGEAGVKPLILALKDRDWRVRRQAVEELARAKTPEVVAPLAAALKDGNEEVRWNAVSALGAHKEPAAAQALVAAWRVNDEYLQHLAEKAIVAMGQASLVPLINALRDPLGTVRRRAASALGKIGDRSALGPLAPVAASDPDSWVAVEAQEAIAKIEKAARPSFPGGKQGQQRPPSPGK